MTTHVTSSSQPRDRWIVDHSPVFYGWVVWAVATLGMAATSPGQSYSVSLFIDFFIDEFNLERTTVSGLYGLGTFIAALSLTSIGRAIDRYGNRRMGVVISGGFAVVLALMSLVTGPFTLLVGFIAIRGLGQGSLFLVSSTAVAQWFARRRGRVMGLSIIGFALFQSAYIPALQRLLETVPWRQAWLILSVGVGLVMLPLMLLLMRNRPEDYDLRPDGSAADPNVDDDAETGTGGHDWTLREAMGTGMFWVFALGRMLIPAWITGLVFHQVSIFEELGHSSATAAQTFSLIALLAAAVSLLTGFLVDRLRPGVVLVSQLAGLILACLVATTMTVTWLLPVYAAGYAYAIGGGGVFDGAVWANLFGRRYQGAIRGFMAMMLVAGTSVGPVMFGLSYDYLGGYAPVMLLGAGLALAAALASWVVPAPVRAADESAPST